MCAVPAAGPICGVSCVRCPRCRSNMRVVNLCRNWSSPCPIETKLPRRGTCASRPPPCDGIWCHERLPAAAVHTAIERPELGRPGPSQPGPLSRVLEAHLDGEDLLRRLVPLAESSETARVISDVLVIDMSTMQLARRGDGRSGRTLLSCSTRTTNSRGSGGQHTHTHTHIYIHISIYTHYIHTHI